MPKNGMASITHQAMPRMPGVNIHGMWGSVMNPDDPDGARRGNNIMPKRPRKPGGGGWEPPSWTIDQPLVGPEQYGTYAPGIDPSALKVEKGLRPGQAFKGLGGPGGGQGGQRGGLFGGLGGGFGGSGGLFAGGMDLSVISQLLQQLLGGQGQDGPITGR